MGICQAISLSDLPCNFGINISENYFKNSFVNSCNDSSRKYLKNHSCICFMAFFSAQFFDVFFFDNFSVNTSYNSSKNASSISHGFPETISSEIPPTANSFNLSSFFLILPALCFINYSDNSFSNSSSEFLKNHSNLLFKILAVSLENPSAITQTFFQFFFSVNFFRTLFLQFFNDFF